MALVNAQADKSPQAQTPAPIWPLPPVSARSAPCTGLVPADQNPPSSFRSQLPEILSRAGKAAFFCSDRSLKQPRNRAEYAHALRFELLGVDPHTRSAAPWLTESRKESHLRILRDYGTSSATWQAAGPAPPV